MQADWLWALLGGGMIGGAAALYLLVNGRIMGASGIVGGLVDRAPGGAERLAFVTGLVVVPAIGAWLAGGAATGLSGNPWLVAVAGLLVGAGTRLANGCTSGHGVCGISRGSLRGIVATLIYLAAGMATVFGLRLAGVIS